MPGPTTKPTLFLSGSFLRSPGNKALKQLRGLLGG